MNQSSRTRQRAQERRQQRQRQMQIRIMIIVGLAALLGAVLLILISRPQASTAAAFDYSGLDQTVDTSLGAPGYAIGQADAPVTLVEYSDFSCPHCRDLAPAIERLIDEYVRDGRLRIVYKPVSFVSPPNSTYAAQAAHCAAQQGKFWEMQSQIWSIFDSNGPGAYTKSILMSRAVQLGMDRDAFSTCFDSPDTFTAVSDVLTETQGRGINGTPALFVNDSQVPFTGAENAYDSLRTAIDAALGG